MRSRFGRGLLMAAMLQHCVCESALLIPTGNDGKQQAILRGSAWDPFHRRLPRRVGMLCWCCTQQTTSAVLALKPGCFGVCWFLSLSQ